MKSAESLRLETLVEGTPSGAMLVNAAGRIVLANRKSEEIFGYAKGGLLGRTVDSLLPRALRARHSGRRRDGTLFPVEVSLIPVAYDGRPAVMAYIVDITERLQAHEAETLRHKETVHREFVANASHEMRTPVAAIKGFAEALRDGALSHPRNGPKFLRIIEENADQLSHMVDDLLHLSALESGHGSPHGRKISLRRLVIKEAEGLSELARRKGVVLKVRLAPRVRVWADPVQLQHVLQNLIENAIQYNRPGGFVEISARRLGASLRVRVRDNGIGIPKSQLLTVFERFQRTKRAVARVVRGTGLGLPIAKAIIEGHGGKIWAENCRCGGTLMMFTLPAAARPRRA